MSMWIKVAVSIAKLCFFAVFCKFESKKTRVSDRCGAHPHSLRVGINSP